MPLYLIIIGAVILLAVLFLFSDVLISGKFIRSDLENEKALIGGIGFIRINILRFLQKPKKHKENKEEKKEEKKETEPFSLDKLEKGLNTGIAVLAYLKKKLCIRRFVLRIRVGTGDAADTGMAVGASYTAMYPILALLDRQFVLKEHALSVVPEFSRSVFSADIHIEIRLKVIYILGLLLKIRKEDVK